jgi:hypothetical protein
VGSGSPQGASVIETASGKELVSEKSCASGMSPTRRERLGGLDGALLQKRHCSLAAGVSEARVGAGSTRVLPKEPGQIGGTVLLVTAKGFDARACDVSKEQRTALPVTLRVGAVHHQRVERVELRAHRRNHTADASRLASRLRVRDCRFDMNDWIGAVIVSEIVIP